MMRARVEAVAGRVRVAKSQAPEFDALFMTGASDKAGELSALGYRVTSINGALLLVPTSELMRGYIEHVAGLCAEGALLERCDYECARLLCECAAVAGRYNPDEWPRDMEPAPFSLWVRGLRLLYASCDARQLRDYGLSVRREVASVLRAGRGACETLAAACCLTELDAKRNSK